LFGYAEAMPEIMSEANNFSIQRFCDSTIQQQTKKAHEQTEKRKSITKHFA
jgi:hypothetical protein